MEYKINPTVFTNMFAMPVSIVDEHIRMAGTMQLRILLWLFRHAAELPATSAQISKALGIDEEEVIDNIEYWNEHGIVLFSDEKVDFSQSQNKKSEVKDEIPPQKEEPVPEKVVEAITVNPPTHEEFVKRCAQSKDIREMLLMTEQRLGTTLSFNMQSILLMLHDDYGLPVEVIMLAVEYAVSRKKITPKFIANVGKLWCEKEIDTIDKAMEYIETQGAAEKYWTEFRDATGVKNPTPTKAQREFLHSWINTLHFSMEMILLAYEEMANNTDKFSFPYMNKVLINWSKDNIKTPADVAKAKKERKEKYESKSKAKKSDDKPAPSYDLDAYTKKAFQNPMDIFKKKGDE